MSKTVLDSSAILAAIFEETGGEIVERMLETSLVSSVNMAEVCTKLTEKGIFSKQTINDLQRLGLEIVDFDLDQAIQAARLRPLTRHLGLSLGDRSCLALAMLRNTTAVTADREWKGLSVCPVEVIR